MLIPYTQIPAATLDELLIDFCSRDGTDNGAFTTLADRKSQLMKLIEKEQVFITYNHDYLQPCLVSREAVPASAIADYRELKRSLAEETAASEQASSATPQQEETQTPPASGSDATGLLPGFGLGRTMMTAAVNDLLESGAVQLEELQSMLMRHQGCDFGDASEECRQANLDAIPSRGRVMSVFRTQQAEYFVITDQGHESTTVMLSSDY